MAIKVKNKNVEEVTYIDELVGGIQRRLKIARVYKNSELLWEYANSNFFSADNCIIITADGYVFNGRKQTN
jgi:hypothetical protein